MDGANGFVVALPSFRDNDSCVTITVVGSAPSFQAAGLFQIKGPREKPGGGDFRLFPYLEREKNLNVKKWHRY